MTVNVLLDGLKSFIEENTKDIILPVRLVKNKTTPEYEKRKGEDVTHRPPKVYKMRLPTKEAETNEIPYILLQFLTGKDQQKPGEPPDSECHIRIIVATYSEDGSEGAGDLLNVLVRIRTALLKAGVVGNQFLLRKPLEYYSNFTFNLLRNPSAKPHRL
ncbi:MAG: hypothetical protein FWH20_00500 [Oscillospiraceae bacterium]|nr:hypothetical protein [Oscillospiraceae bacterium]